MNMLEYIPSLPRFLQGLEVEDSLLAKIFGLCVVINGDIRVFYVLVDPRSYWLARVANESAPT